MDLKPQYSYIIRGIESVVPSIPEAYQPTLIQGVYLSLRPSFCQSILHILGWFLYLCVLKVRRQCKDQCHVSDIVLQRYAAHNEKCTTVHNHKIKLLKLVQGISNPRFQKQVVVKLIDP